MSYRHIQQSPLVWIITAVVVVVDAITIAVLVALNDGAPATPIVLAVAPPLFAIPMAWAFGRLAIEVNCDEVRVRFGLPWPRRRIALTEIESAQPVRNTWWLGWGIRKIPKGWMFNIWGLDAVELVLASGKRFRIGTDEPVELTAAIQSARE